MKNSKQMELNLSTSSQEDTLANLSPSQVVKKALKIRDTSGQSILDLSKSSDRLGLLEKMLVDTLNSVSTPYSRTWKVKATPQGRLVFQLLASAPNIKEKESGLWATPNTMDHLPQRSPEALRKQATTTRKGRTKPANLREQVDPIVMKMWRTPDNMAGGSNLPGIQKALDEGHLKRPSGQPIQIRLSDQVREERIWPTPTVNDSKNNGGPSQHKRKTKALNVVVGGKLNPTWVEWLMGYPSGWTDLNHSETVLSHKSPTTSVRPFWKLWPTPRASDPGSRPNGKGGKVLSEEVMIEEGLRQRGKKL